MSELKNKSMQRFNVDIGKEGDDLMKEFLMLTKKRKLSKRKIVQLALEYCKMMKVDFNEPLQRNITLDDLEKSKKQIIKEVDSKFMMLTNQLTPLLNKLKTNDH